MTVATEVASTSFKCRTEGTYGLVLFYILGDSIKAVKATESNIGVYRLTDRVLCASTSKSALAC